MHNERLTTLRAQRCHRKIYAIRYRPTCIIQHSDMLIFIIAADFRQIVKFNESYE